MTAARTRLRQDPTHMCQNTDSTVTPPEVFCPGSVRLIDLPEIHFLLRQRQGVFVFLCCGLILCIDTDLHFPPICCDSSSARALSLNYSDKVTALTLWCLPSLSISLCSIAKLNMTDRALQEYRPGFALTLIFL